MLKKTLPAWQQVLLTALNNVPKAKDGRDAWQKLNENEQAAVMGFLGEHCGHDPEQVQAMLDETAGMVKPRSKRMLILTGAVIATIAVIWILIVLVNMYSDQATHAIHVGIWLFNSISVIINAKGDRMLLLWSEHEDNEDSTRAALEDMHRAQTGTVWAAVRKWWLFTCLILLVLWLVAWFMR